MTLGSCGGNSNSDSNRASVTSFCRLGSMKHIVEHFAGGGTHVIMRGQPITQGPDEYLPNCPGISANLANSSSSKSSTTYSSTTTVVPGLYATSFDCHSNTLKLRLLLNPEGMITCSVVKGAAIIKVKPKVSNREGTPILIHEYIDSENQATNFCLGLFSDGAIEIYTSTDICEAHRLDLKTQRNTVPSTIAPYPSTFSCPDNAISLSKLISKTEEFICTVVWITQVSSFSKEVTPQKTSISGKPLELSQLSNTDTSGGTNVCLGLFPNGKIEIRSSSSICSESLFNS